MENDMDFKVQQVLEELERMQPDIDNEVDAEFAEKIQAMSNAHSGAWGYAQASNLDDGSPEISQANLDQMAENFQNEQANLDAQVEEFRNERVNFRANFLIGQYYEDASKEEKSAIFDAVQNSLNPPDKEQETEAEAESEQGDYFNAADFVYADGGEAGDSLSSTFGDAAAPSPSVGPSVEGGFEA